ncbi:MAG TPA: NAD(P)H-dependent oxidoreductase [Candidatus Tidjanibacter faecipullorum]|uniref:NAD(P)H-dependent oxidoreductase n=1 Tax=Candidatus Tidjanibacter faecipullorum TaxID=2838766 RepID=A0A9D2DCH5_9BACT|nr:NAD(P)H-dependent oxidoreductase [Candidatus Tidjanibacter faecipullorum]
MLCFIFRPQQAAGLTLNTTFINLNVIVINGSPRGQYSTTQHSVLYLQKLFKEDHFTIVEAATRIRSLEKDLSPIIEAVRSADIILFAYPVYTFIVPAQLHRLIELLKESGIDLKGKYAAQITTSKRIYDDLPHRNIGRMLSVKLISWLFNTPSIRRKMSNKPNEGMAIPYCKIIDQLDAAIKTA